MNWFFFFLDRTYYIYGLSSSFDLRKKKKKEDIDLY